MFGAARKPKVSYSDWGGFPEIEEDEFKSNQGSSLPLRSLFGDWTGGDLPGVLREEGGSGSSGATRGAGRGSSRARRAGLPGMDWDD